MAERIRKVFWWLVVAFVLYAIFSNPAKSGQTVHDIWNSIAQGLRNLGHFFQSIIDNGN